MLYLVATPIGNLGDMSARAIDVLKSVDLVLSEDTRRTGVLLKHFGIEARQISFHDHNERRQAERILKLLDQGKDLALVTDGGTPAISDPGYTLVRAAIQRDILVTMVPGPAALIGALVLSGLPLHSFTFRGFPPRKGGPRKRFFAEDVASPHTLIYYESPHRLVAALQDALAVFGERPAALANDLTKKFESVWRGTLAEIAVRVAAEKRLLGEYVLVVEGGPGREPPEDSDESTAPRPGRERRTRARRTLAAGV